MMYCSIGNIFLHNFPFDETGLWRAASLALINTLQSCQEQMEMPYEKKKNCWVIKEASGVILLFWAIMINSLKQHSYWAGLLLLFLIKSSLALSAAGWWSRCPRQLGWAAGCGCWVSSPGTSSRAWKSCSRACTRQVFPLAFFLFCSHFSFSLPRRVCFWVSAEPFLCILYPLS